MKKVITLVLALAMVFGVSAMTMAGNDLDDSADVGIDIKVEDYAELDLDSNSLDLGEINPEDNKVTDQIGYALKANTSVTVTSEVESGLSEKSELELDTDEADSYTYSDYDEGINIKDGKIGVTANLAQDDDENGDGAWEKIEAGAYKGTVIVTVSAQ